MSYSDIDSKALTAFSFFGALTFTAMILLIQFSNDIKYSEILIPWTAVVSFLFIMATVIILNADYVINPKRLSILLKICFFGGFYGLIFVIPAIIFSFNSISAMIILVFEIIILGLVSRSIKGPKQV